MLDYNFPRKPRFSPFSQLAILLMLVGLLFLFSSVVVLFKLMPQPELKGDAKIFMDGMVASHYLMPVVKVIELVCSLAFLSGRFVPLATVVLFPITVNIVLFNALVTPETLPVGIFVLFGNLFLAYAYRKNYVTLLAAK